MTALHVVGLPHTQANKEHSLCESSILYDINGAYCIIFLTKGYYTKVDPEDYDWLDSFKWYTNDGGNNPYAYRGIAVPKTRKIQQIPMHKQVLDIIQSDLTVDHKNGDTLDNRKNNLRLATRQQQAINRGMRSDNKSGYKGVYWLNYANKWRAQIKHNGKRISLGVYENVEDAAEAYEKAAIEYHGEWRRQ